MSKSGNIGWLWQSGRLPLYISWVLVIISMIFIFILSSQPAKISDELSRNVAKTVGKSTEQAHKTETGKNYKLDTSRLNSELRKYAHMMVFFVLGFFVVNAFRRSGLKGFKAFSVSLALCAAYALSDEIHQIFVPGRGCEFTDVLLDSAEALIGITLYCIVSFAISKARPEAFGEQP